MDGAPADGPISYRQRLLEDFRDFPATTALCAIWLVVFTAMFVQHFRQGQGVTLGQVLLGVRGGHRFGDMTLRELYAGELWRLLTATFVHYGVVHVGMNLYGLFVLGTLIESWYGSGILVAIYVATGAGGNLLSAVGRFAVGSNPTIASGGGSTVVMGLVAVCAVVGWKAHTKGGDHLRRLMMMVIISTAALGLFLPLVGLPIIDNWGHAGGTVAGAAIGLFGGTLTRLSQRRLVTGMVGLGASLLIVAGAAAQVADDQDESRKRAMIAETAQARAAAIDRISIRVEEINQTYKAVITPRIIRRGTLSASLPRKPEASVKSATKPTATIALDPEDVFFRTVLGASFASLTSMQANLDAGSTSLDYRRLVLLTRRSMVEPPTIEEFREFEARMTSLEQTLKNERNFAQMQAATVGLLPRVD